MHLYAHEPARLPKPSLRSKAMPALGRQRAISCHLSKSSSTKKAPSAQSRRQLHRKRTNRVQSLQKKCPAAGNVGDSKCVSVYACQFTSILLVTKVASRPNWPCNHTPKLAVQPDKSCFRPKLAVQLHTGRLGPATSQNAGLGCTYLLRWFWEGHALAVFEEQWLTIIRN